MTCIEKLRELHPDWDDEKIWYYTTVRCVAKECIMPRPSYCDPYVWEKSSKADCEKCWSREIPELVNDFRHETLLYLTGEDRSRMKRIGERVGKSSDEVVSAALKIYEDGLNAVDAARNRSYPWGSVSFEVTDMVDFDEQE